MFSRNDTMYGMDQTSEWHHKDIFAHTIQVVDNAANYQIKWKFDLLLGA